MAPSQLCRRGMLELGEPAELGPRSQAWAEGTVRCHSPPLTANSGREMRRCLLMLRHQDIHPQEDSEKI